MLQVERGKDAHLVLTGWCAQTLGHHRVEAWGSGGLVWVLSNPTVWRVLPGSENRVVLSLKQEGGAAFLSTSYCLKKKNSPYHLTPKVLQKVSFFDHSLFSPWPWDCHCGGLQRWLRFAEFGDRGERWDLVCQCSLQASQGERTTLGSYTLLCPDSLGDFKKVLKLTISHVSRNKVGGMIRW